MKNLKQIAATAVLVFVLALSAMAGEISTGGITTPPKPEPTPQPVATSTTSSETADTSLADVITWLLALVF